MSSDCETCNRLWNEFAQKTDVLLKLIEKRSGENRDKGLAAAIEAAIHERQQARRKVVTHEEECPRREPTGD